MKVLSVLLVALFCFSALAFAQEGLRTETEAVPKVFQVTPTGEATLAASRWMQFSNCTGETACCDILNSKSLQYKESAPQFSEIPGLVLEVPVDNAYRAKGSILIVWTLRIEGMAGQIIDPWTSTPRLCGAWHGSITETFKGGQVYSQAFVSTDGRNYAEKGQPSNMTIPDGGAGVSTRISDPTHSGSYLLEGSDFGGTLPDKVWIKIYWKNDTSLIVTSKDKYRSLIVTLLPAK